MPDVSLGFVHYPVKTLGYGRRVGVWLAGCNRRCPHCETPELQTFSYETDEDSVIDEIIGYLKDGADGLTVSGGEPFEQAWFLRKLLEKAVTYTEDVLVFTGYTLAQLQERQDEDTDAALALVGVLVDGEYVDSLNDGRGLRGSSNQNIHRLKESLIVRYEGAEIWNREKQIAYKRGRFIYIGID